MKIKAFKYLISNGFRVCVEKDTLYYKWTECIKMTHIIGKIFPLLELEISSMADLWNERKT